MLYGADYYPELWPRGQWPRDLDLMAAAGLNVVRIGDLCWATLEPAPGRYTFDLVDEVLALLGERNMRAVLATPTASPPPWLVQEDPSVMPVDAQGRQVAYGSWGAHCLSSPTLCQRTHGIVTALADRYGQHPAVAGWQVDNELDVHGMPCHCARCTAAFQAWLRERCGTLDALNAAWGTANWSHLYDRWDQIPAPLETLAVYVHNPGLRLDFRRFSSDLAIAYYRLQAEILHRLAPNQPRTHNLPGRTLVLDAHRLAAEADVAAWDNYPVWSADPQMDPALTHDIMRGLKRRPFWVLEQQVGTMDRPPYRAPQPGLLRLWALQAVSRGADAVLWFLWQTYRSGAEQYIVGLLDHAGRPTRFYHEMAVAVGELRRVERLLDHSVPPRAEVALLVSYESLWALGLQPQSEAETDPWNPVAECYAPLYRRNVPVDVLGFDADLAGYRLVLVPAPYLADAALAARLEGYVAGGGTLLVTARAGSKDRTNLWPEGPLPGSLRALLGVTVREWDTPSRADGQRVVLAFDAEGPTVTCDVSGWCEILDPEGATPLARYLDLFYAGAVAATRRTHGRGEVVYAGARGTAFMEHLLAALLTRAGVTPLLATPDGVEAAARQGPGGTLIFLLNHAAGERVVDLPPGLVDPVAGQAVSGPLALPPRDARILLWEDRVCRQ